MANTTVGAIVYTKGEKNIKVLLTKRNIDPFKNYWCLPGGHIDPYENAEAAVIREVKEETNIDINPKFLTYMDEIFPELKIHNVVLMYFGNAKGKVEADPKEVSETGWFSLEEAGKLELAFNHNKALSVFRDFIQENEIS